MRLGFASGAIGGAASGFLALLLWGATVVVYRLAMGEPLGASDPTTPRQALLNAGFSAVFAGLPLGGMAGAFGGAMIGPMIPRRRAPRLRLGVWMGAVLVASVGAVLAGEDWVIAVPSLLEGGLAGAVGGWVADSLFRRWSGRCD